MTAHNVSARAVAARKEANERAARERARNLVLSRGVVDTIPLGLQCKLVSIIVHIEEAGSADGHVLDWSAVASLLADPEVRAWVAEMDSARVRASEAERTMTEQQITTAAEEVEADDFDDMMSALDWMFHVHECPNHSGAERLTAYAEAKQAFAAYCGFDGPAEEVATDIIEKYANDEGVPVPNAPTSDKVH